MIHKRGFIEGRIGPMKSGKSTFLIGEFHKYHHKKRCVVVSKQDTRSQSPCINSHTKASLDATFAVNDAMEVLSENFDQYDVFFFDEVQFMPNIAQAMEKLAKMDKIVFFSGLDLFANGKQWPHTVEACGVADKYEKICGVCEICEQEAGFTKLVKGELNEDGILIGDSAYQVVCRKCK